MPHALLEETADALLFDMDGTILTSLKAAERVWGAWAERQGLDVATFLPKMHGARGIDTIRNLGLPGIDPQVEADGIAEAEMIDVADIEQIPGAAAFLSGLPVSRWTIVTSSPRRLAARRLEAAGLPAPETMITAEDIERGKPAPDGFLLAARRLGTTAARCLIFEDAPTGIAAAEAAGGKVVVVTAWLHGEVEERHLAIPDYRSLRTEVLPDGRIRVFKAD
ncbi:HAD-IA family hydrolase [Consotaella salsifontis]|uniref:Sugar-phosphatase n=1 Tax=Consotaella salsifontis TaxID=1365950 RepID=A0A1T4MS13_9HYPH|nr:HAD-IA family hydrolase [Consotaella salsifontis]SJZ69701.1 sugar-phosphatase [Consotaella salsifontis]